MLYLVCEELTRFSNVGAGFLLAKTFGLKVSAAKCAKAQVLENTAWGVHTLSRRLSLTVAVAGSLAQLGMRTSVWSLAPCCYQPCGGGHRSCSCPWGGGHHLTQRNPITREHLPARRLGMAGQGSQSCSARRAVLV